MSDTHAQTIHVASHGNDAHRGTKRWPLRSIAEALARLESSGGLIKLAPGNYHAPGWPLPPNIALHGEPNKMKETIVRLDGDV